MNCMRCGRETVGEQVFCQDCQIEMDKYPVRPGTVVQLPKRKETTVTRKVPKRRTVPLEEQVKALRRRVRILTVLLAVALALVIAMVYPSVSYWTEDHFAPGQNYNTVTSKTADTAANTAE